jgi:cysteine desulfurase
MEGEIVFPIYLDNNATTPVDPRVKAAVLPWLTDHFGNPSSVTYAQGVQANEALEKARAQVADLLGAQSHSEVYFTSGASEANAIAISGVIEHLAIQSREKGTDA